MRTERSSDQAGLQNQLRQVQLLRSVPLSQTLIEADDPISDDDLMALKAYLGFAKTVHNTVHALGFREAGTSKRGGGVYGKRIELGAPVQASMRNGDVVNYTAVRVRITEYTSATGSHYARAARTAGKATPRLGIVYVVVKLWRRREDGSETVNSNGRFFKLYASAIRDHEINDDVVDQPSLVDLTAQLSDLVTRIERRFAGRKDVQSVGRFINILKTAGKSYPT